MAFKSPYRGNVGLRQWREFAYGGLEETYVEKVTDTGPLVYFPQAELVGPPSIDVINGWDGVYAGVTLNDPAGQPSIDGEPVPRFDGINDFNNIWTAQLVAGFNGAEGTMAVWMRVFNAGVWTDGATRAAIQCYVAANNFVVIRKSAVNNTLDFIYTAGGVGLTRSVNPFSSIAWVNAAIVWSAAGNFARAYIDGVQQGVDLVGLGVWAGAVANGRTNIGAGNVIGAAIFNGWLAHGAVWDRPLTPAEVLEVATP